MLVRINDKFYNLDQVIYISDSNFIRFSNDEAIQVEDENLMKKILDHFNILGKGEVNEKVHCRTTKKKDK